jgi:drug/metabolite transporter (DMT)-like permease
METNHIMAGGKHNGKLVAGIIILVIGSFLLIQQMNCFFFPHWLFSWPMWMIGYGVYIGAKHNFRKAIWLWLVVLGTAFLLTENVHDAGRFIWPVSVIGLGAWMVMRHNEKAAGKPVTDASYTEV